MQKLIALRRCFDEVMLHTELLVNLWVIWQSLGQVGLFKWQLGIRIVPCFRLIESARRCQPKLVLISHIRELTAISQLTFEKLVVAVKLAFDGVVRFYSRHFAERLNICVPECSTAVFWCDILEQVRVVGEARARYCWL